MCPCAEQESGDWPPPSLLLARGISQMLEMNHTWVNMVTFVVDLNMRQLAEDANMLNEQLVDNPHITMLSVEPAACWMCLASVLSVSAAVCAAVLQSGVLPQ